MSDVNIENLICHGLGGIGLGNYIQYSSESIVNSCDENYRSSLLKCKSDKNIDKFLFSLYRLNQILRYRTIFTFDGLKKQGLPLFNSNEKIGDYNSDNSLCFAMKDQKFEQPEGITPSSDYGGGFGNFIKNNISIMLANDKNFANLHRSKNYDGIMRDEIRIEGSIENPNIIAVGIPLITSLEKYKSRGERFDKLYSYEYMMTFIRELLDFYGYENVSVVDSSYGYNLENKEILEIIKTNLNESESRITWPWVDKLSGDWDYYLAGDIRDDYKAFCESSPNHGFTVTKDGQITCLDFPHALPWDIYIAENIKNFIDENKLGAIQVNASIGAHPFIVVNGMSERQILDKREETANKNNRIIFIEEEQK